MHWGEGPEPIYGGKSRKPDSGLPVLRICRRRAGILCVKVVDKEQREKYNVQYVRVWKMTG